MPTNQINQPKNTMPLLYPYISKRMEKQLKYQVFKDKIIQSNEAISQWNIFCSHQKEYIVLNNKLTNIGREPFLNGLYRFIYDFLKSR